jgi:hypothetical protein
MKGGETSKREARLEARDEALKTGKRPGMDPKLVSITRSDEGPWLAPKPPGRARETLSGARPALPQVPAANAMVVDQRLGGGIRKPVECRAWMESKGALPCSRHDAGSGRGAPGAGQLSSASSSARAACKIRKKRFRCGSLRAAGETIVRITDARRLKTRDRAQA